MMMTIVICIYVYILHFFCVHVGGGGGCFLHECRCYLYKSDCNKSFHTQCIVFCVSVCHQSSVLNGINVQKHFVNNFFFK